MKNYSENTDEIMVSIFCLCYNHEKYLVKCLEGFVNQKTQFKFEVLVHDDASTDNSAKIIREFELKYPSIIKPIYQLDNQYSKGVSIGLKWQMSRAKGRYIAFCDGDDYWCDHNKLQKQFNIMEGNNNCHLCLHRVELIKESGEKLNRCCPKKKFKRTTWSTDEFFEIYLGDREHFQTSSYFIRRDDVDILINDNFYCKFNSKRPFFDANIISYFGSLGEVEYINEICSAYRVGVIGSWTSRCKDCNIKLNLLNLRIYEISNFDRYTNYKYNKYCLQLLNVCEYEKKITNYKLLNPCIDQISIYKFMLTKEVYPYFKYVYPVMKRIVIRIMILFPIIANKLLEIKNGK